MSKTIKLNLDHFWPLIALCLGFFMVIMDVTIVNVALVDMKNTLNGGIFWLQWVVGGYTLMFACLLLSAGSLGDRIGAKPTFLTGLFLFILTSVACGLANSFLQLVIFRLLQGTAAALLVPTSLGLIAASYPDKDLRAKAIGIWGAVGGIAAALGPISGGILITWFGWRSIFFVNIPFGIIGILMTYYYVPNLFTHKKSKFDFLGQILAIITVASLAFSLIEAGKLSWSANPVWFGFLIFIIASFAFLWVERSVSVPMLPLNLFQSKTFSTTIVVGMILNIGVYGEFFVLSLYFQQIKDYSVLMTGFAFLPLLGIVAFASYFGGKVTSVFGSKLPITIGLGVGCLGFLSMLITTAQTSYIMLIFPLLAIGFGIAFTMPAATAATIHSAPQDRVGIASGALNSSRQIGSLIGVAIFGTVVNITANFIFGMHITLMISAIIFILGCIMVLFQIKEKKAQSVPTDLSTETAG